MSPSLRRRAEAQQDSAVQAFDVDYPLPAERQRRDLPDVTSALVFLLVALGLFFVPLGATLMQNDAIAAVLAP